MKERTKKHRGLIVEVFRDDVARALRTFSNKIQELGTMDDLRTRQSYEKPAVARQRLKKQARNRWERKVKDMITAGEWHIDQNY